MNNHFVSINLQYVGHKGLEYVRLLHIQNMDKSYMLNTKKIILIQVYFKNQNKKLTVLLNVVAVSVYF